MLKLRTKTNFPIPTKRGVIQGIVRLIIERLEIDINNIVAIGYYYFLDENNAVVKLDDAKSLNFKVTKFGEFPLIVSFFPP